jgi:pyruvate,water dikinase
VMGKITGEISVRDISDKHARQVPAEGGGIHEVANEAAIATQPCLTDEQLMALREVGRKVERHYGRPQDIEWALDEAGNLFLLQSRPETVWSARDAAPVADRKENPLAHVMNIFGGRK